VVLALTPLSSVTSIVTLNEAAPQIVTSGVVPVIVVSLVTFPMTVATLLPPKGPPLEAVNVTMAVVPVTVWKPEPVIGSGGGARPGPGWGENGEMVMEPEPAEKLDPPPPPPQAARADAAANAATAAREPNTRMGSLRGSRLPRPL